MRKATVTYSFQGRDSVPMIRLRGRWLEKAGFEEGMRVHVDVAAGRLTILSIDETVPRNPEESSR